ncbi:MAG: bifunctional phosphopantothenoylcysteine decarboxylase/phosphopantothenate--cysteine ligase CoaBC [Armatimonadota bacterium]|nr:bifunctional phosphopantothenoylcysteine decarboxylase/phosphopantothenate--cysteine ligase CoaBC [Armatimonadota bacterium]
MPTVVLGVSASIAAYKAADLASQLVKSGVEVYPVLTADAARFVQPATFRALTHHPCPIDVFEEPFPGEIAHIWLARNCDLFVIIPASMNVIAQLANGLAQDMLTAAALACTAPILLAPGMNTGMWNNPATQANLAKLRDYGYYFIEPTTGRLACRTEGVGRMADVPTIFEAIQEMLGRSQTWRGRKVLVTAGPTREPLDPVRYLSNRSSGKMGYALAEAARLRGAEVTLISGPTALPAPGGVEFVRVETAAQMHDAVLPRAEVADFILAAAAVSDYRPAEFAAQKIKKGAGNPIPAHEFATLPSEGRDRPGTNVNGPGIGSETGGLTLTLIENDDILALLGRQKRPNQILVGFAAETEHLLDHARRKIETKNLDWIVANDVTAEGAGFDVDTNIVTLIGRNGQEIALPLLTKREVAERILDAVG